MRATSEFGFVLGGPHAVELDRAAARRLDAHDRLHRGRLARAVRPDQAEDLAGGGIEKLRLLHRDQAAEALGQAGRPRASVLRSPGMPLGCTLQPGEYASINIGG